MPNTNEQAMSTSVSVKPRTILRRILSHHEIATLLLLLHSPIDVSAKPEIPMLQEAGLVEQVGTADGAARFQLTPDGTAVLRGLGVS
jgi:hypothetical protein